MGVRACALAQSVSGWPTNADAHIPHSQRNAALRNAPPSQSHSVELPASCLPPGAVSADGAVRCTSTHGKMLQEALHFGFRVEAPVKVLDSRCFVRISAMVYNDRADFEALAAAVLRIRWRAGADGSVELAPE